MRILFILLGSFSILYFIGIVLYAGLSSLFPCIWAAAGIVCYAIAILLRLETTHHWNILSIFPKPVKAVPYSGDFGDPCIFDNRRSDFFGNASETI